MKNYWVLCSNSTTRKIYTYNQITIVSILLTKSYQELMVWSGRAVFHNQPDNWYLILYSDIVSGVWQFTARINLFFLSWKCSASKNSISHQREAGHCHRHHLLVVSCSFALQWKLFHMCSSHVPTLLFFYSPRHRKCTSVILHSPPQWLTWIRTAEWIELDLNSDFIYMYMFLWTQRMCSIFLLPGRRTMSLSAELRAEIASLPSSSQPPLVESDTGSRGSCLTLTSPSLWP